MNIDAFVLVGGRSTRFGSPKALADLGGENLATRAVETIRDAFPDMLTTLVAADDKQFDATALMAGTPMVFDIRPGFGAWSGLNTAIAYSRSEWTLVLACDQPCMPSDFLTLLAAQAEDSIEVVIPRQPDGRLQPLCALYRTRPTLAALESIFDGRSLLPALAGFVETLVARVIEPSEYLDLPNADRIFVNINTVSDLDACG
ncbi:MAG TPA: molybdenum cofactor guanylyltransferase [Pyrinomonadaceae bacterium]|jgi:molybdopterin-guanine dinucleotide biosynthesis protein A|nr:molybdenum cofactor guanylyltransferase [Pyrinomonadaceae bacterium]